MTVALPPQLAERCRPLNPEPPGRGSYVLYWMHHAMRSEENPALETAVAVGAELGLPVIVYQGLAGDHPYNSDRHHFFILQAAREVSGALAELGIRYVFHLPEDRGGPAPLGMLCDGAALIVVEEMPVPPFSRWQPALADRAGRAVWAVDARCLLPMQSVGKAYDRAFRFRQRVEDEYRTRCAARWPGEPPASVGLADSPVAGLDGLSTREDRDLLGLIARCDIDHGVWPVFHTPGGSAAAGARWDAFRDTGLSRYHRLRNDAAIEPPAGVSRLSAYLHYGQISPFRVAREAAAAGGPGAEKFLDELLVWRELAHNFCFHHRELESLEAIPAWARESLQRHATDPRPRDLGWEALARGRSGDALWDAAQLSLLRHGELHNNLRMTWAKAIPLWTPSPEAALATLIDLNHRYALDGNDPNSYGGLLWALGQFDRPFEPDSPVLGRVRARSTEGHARRLDLAAYRRRIERPAGTPARRVAVIGAGVAGLAAARSLADAGHVVTVFEKSRGPGGRTATRRTDGGQFDHGAQYFTAHDPAFLRHLEAWCRAGVVAPWPERLQRRSGAAPAESLDGGRRWTGVPGMNALCRHIASEMDVRYENRVTGVRRQAGGWSLELGGRRMDFDALVVSAPAPQAADLLAEASPALAARADAVEFAPCWAVMGRAESAAEPPFDAAFVDDEVLAWASADHAKPGRRRNGGWVLHATSDWSAAHLDADERDVVVALNERLQTICSLRLDSDTAAAHRWRYARVVTALDEGALLEPDPALVVCGDWCLGESRVENAWLSGIAGAARLCALFGTEAAGACAD